MRILLLYKLLSNDGSSAAETVMEAHMPARFWFALICCSILLSLFTVAAQVNNRYIGMPYLQENGPQYMRHQMILEGRDKVPYQYRLLSEYLVEGCLSVVKRLGVPRAVPVGFILFRLAQNALIFLLAGWYYRKLGLNGYLAVIGLSLLAWGMCHTFHASNLYFNTYSDIAFYLLAALVILAGRYLWLVPIVLLAALNRETSGLIPLMVVAYGLQCRSRSVVPAWKPVLVGLACLLVYGVVLGVLVYTYRAHRLSVPYGQHQGIDLLIYNLTKANTWYEGFATLGLVPFVAIVSMKRWPIALKQFFWAVVPLWFVIHALTGILAESRLLLVPYALVLIPGAMFTLMWSIERDKSATQHTEPQPQYAS